jgi:class 3 adenylate cyclase
MADEAGRAGPRAGADRLKTDLLRMRERLGVVLTAYRKLLRQTKRAYARIKASERESVEANDRVASLALELKRERDRERSLLESILPEPVARRMAENAHALVADEFQEVSILSASVADFERVTAGFGARKLVESLNQLFSILDVLVADRGIEKLRSSGERYLCVCGAPSPRLDHAERMAEFALDMADMMRKLKVEERAPLQIRIGIHMGPAIAGVVGERKYVWDLFGPTMKAVTVIEEICLPGKILVSGAFAAKLKDRYRFSRAQGQDPDIPGVDGLYFMETRLPQA